MPPAAVKSNMRLEWAILPLHNGERRRKARFAGFPATHQSGAGATKTHQS
jgi:hypothetical protein